MNIPNYLMTKSAVNGFWFYHYLHIEGGAGHKKRGMGGFYKYVLAYIMPEENQKRYQNAPFGASLECFCKNNKIPFGGGDTSGEAFENFLKSNEKSDVFKRAIGLESFSK